jgi:hypothetical protein
MFNWRYDVNVMKITVAAAAIIIIIIIIIIIDRLCGLVVRIPKVRVRFPALPDFLRSGGSGTGSTQPREYN